jgi:predicted nucleic acid-binding protein
MDRACDVGSFGGFLRPAWAWGPDYTFQLVELVDPDLRRMSGLVRQYADLRLGGTDASVVAICERLGIVTVATVNLRDFATVRPRHIPAFITVPGLN